MPTIPLRERSSTSSIIPRPDQRYRTRTRPRLVHQRADPPVPQSEELRGVPGRSPVEPGGGGRTYRVPLEGEQR